MKDNDACMKCGQCCHVIKEGKLIKCRYLIKIGNTTRCRIYPNRIGTQICKGWKCGYREGSTFDYKDCPMNDPLRRKTILNIDVKNQTLLASTMEPPSQLLGDIQKLNSGEQNGK